MGMLVVFFVIIATLSFSILALGGKQDDEQTAMGVRLQSLLVPRAPLDSEGVESLIREQAAALDWMERSLRDTRFITYIRKLLLRAQSKKTAASVLSVSMALFVFGWLLVEFLTSQTLLSMVIGAAAGSSPVIVLRAKGRRRLAAFDAMLPDCIEMCSRSLRAGHSLVAALAMVSEEAAEPAKTEFAEVFRKQNYGLPLRDALMQMLDRVPSRDLQVVITGILVQKDIGGNLVEVMERIVAVVRDRSRIQAEVRTHTAQGRLTGWILCLLPPVLLVLVNLMTPGYSRVLFHEEVGRKLLYIGLGLLAAGAFTIRRIIHGIEV